MKEVTKLMIKEFQLNKLGFDFMGYLQSKKDIYTFHHIKAKRDGGLLTRDNGAILFTTPHEYLHKIELYENALYIYISQELKEMNKKGYLDIYNLKRIQDTLRYFEDRHKNDSTRKGKILIKDTYYHRKKF